MKVGAHDKAAGKSQCSDEQCDCKRGQQHAPCEHDHLLALLVRPQFRRLLHRDDADRDANDAQDRDAGYQRRERAVIVGSKPARE